MAGGLSSCDIVNPGDEPGGPEVPVNLWPDRVVRLFTVGGISERQRGSCDTVPLAFLQVADGRLAVGEILDSHPRIHLYEPHGTLVRTRDLQGEVGTRAVVSWRGGFVWFSRVTQSMGELEVVVTDAEGAPLQRAVLEGAGHFFGAGVIDTAEGGSALNLYLQEGRRLITLSASGQIVRSTPFDADINSFAERDGGGYVGVEYGGESVIVLGSDGTEISRWSIDFGVSLRSIHAVGDGHYLLFGVRYGDGISLDTATAILMDSEGHIIWHTVHRSETKVGPTVGVLTAYGGPEGGALTIVRSSPSSVITTLSFGPDGTPIEVYDWPINLLVSQPWAERRRRSVAGFLPNGNGGVTMLFSVNNLGWMSGLCYGEVWAEVAEFEGLAG